MTLTKKETTLQQIVDENGGGNFVGSVFIRSDGFLVQLNLTFLERIARSGKLGIFCKELKKSFREVVDDAEKEAKRSISGKRDGENKLPCVQVGD